jgi:hypothetical protein
MTTFTTCTLDRYGLEIPRQDFHGIDRIAPQVMMAIPEKEGQKAAALFEATGRRLPQGFRFQGFQTSDLQERKVRRYSRDALKASVGLGLRADQHFRATWVEPRDMPIEPYDVIICLADDATP